MLIDFKSILKFDKRKIIFTVIMGLAFAVCIVAGDTIYSEIYMQFAYMSVSEIVIWVLKKVMITIGTILLIWILLSLEISIKSVGRFDKIAIYIVGWLLMVLCYVPAIISFAPGLLAYDTWWQTNQIYGYFWMTNHHPLLHTYIWKFFLELGDYVHSIEIGILGYSIFQVSVMCLIFTFFTYWIGKRLNNKAFQIVVYLWFALNPTFHLLIIQSDKDVFFGGCMLLWSVFLIEAVEKKKISIFLIISTMLCCAFRHNGFYALLVVGIIFFFICISGKKRREKYGKVCISLFVGIIVYFVALKFVLAYTGYQDTTSREMVSVPCTQLASVYMEEVYFNPQGRIPDEDLELIKKYIPTADKYNKRLADFVKGWFEYGEFDKNPSEFIGLWLRCLVKYPERYIYSYAQLTIYYWCPNAIDFPDMYSGEDYIQSVRRDTWDEIYVADWNCWEEGRKFYQVIGSFDNKIMRLPVIRFFFSLSFPLFLMVFVLGRLLYKKEYAQIVYMLFPILYMCTLLLGPVCNYRYIFPLLLLTPILMGLIIKSK